MAKQCEDCEILKREVTILWKLCDALSKLSGVTGNALKKMCETNNDAQENADAILEQSKKFLSKYDLD